MAEKPICIITAEGMKCISSPLAQHYPGERACELVEPPVRFRDAAEGAATAVKEKIAEAVTRSGNPVIDDDNAKVIARVVKLLIECQFDLTGPFTIVKQG